MNMKWFANIFVLFCCHPLVFGQNPVANEQVILEAIELSENTDNIEADYLISILQDYQKKPLNINHCSIQELSEFPLLNPLQQAEIIKHRNEYGAFNNWQDLNRLDNFNPSQIEILKNFISIESTEIIEIKTLKQSIANASFVTDFTLKKDLEKRQGYLHPAAYLGSDFKHASRFRFSYPNKFSIGFVTEKDAGERFFHNNQIEHWSAHLSIENKDGYLKKFVLGDYQVQLGQGLIMGPSFAIGKAVDLNSSYRGGKTLRENTSANEIGFLRGAAALLQQGSHQLLIAAAQQKVDAKYSTDSSITYPISGLHRTTTELAAKKQGLANTMCFAYKLGLNNTELGLNYISTQRAFNEIKSSQDYASISFNHHFNRGIIYGEMANRLNTSYYSSSMGALVNLHKKLNFSFNYRVYLDSITSPIANPFRNTSSSQQEKGSYFNFEYLANKNLKLNALLDQYQTKPIDYPYNSWLANRDLVVQISYSVKRKLKSYIRVRKQLKSDNQNDEFNPIQAVVHREKLSLRANCNYHISSETEFRMRWESNFTENTAAPGQLFYHELHFHPVEKKYALSYRMAWFKTPNFDSRIYAYEMQVPYVYSIPAYYGTGTRYIFKLRYKPTASLSLWIRYAIWKFADRDFISSGTQKIPGATAQDLSLNIRYKF